MHVIIVGPAYPYRGGIAALNERLASEYEKQGHKVEIYTFTLQYPGFLFPGKTQYSESPAPDGLKIYRKINSCNPFNWIKVIPTMSTEVQNATGYDHAGKYESSILMALYPDSVKLDRIDDIKHWFTESAREANAELGEIMVEKSLEYLEATIV